ncbi:hypothetical protein CRG98_022811 [Punica granatum]|uniref:Uncharacterized protein n=1 Tax=Punica granatum TaxID=22663 RepID=A0A2I0JKK2_PUNGR|nr:hypothetical protein CRG98_022811 [Punica granatum]
MHRAAALHLLHWASAPHRAPAPHLLHWASTSHRAPALHLLLGFGPASGFGPTFGLRPHIGPRSYIYCFWAPASHLLLSGFETSHLLLSGSSEIQNRLGFKFIQAILRGASLILQPQKITDNSSSEQSMALPTRRKSHSHGHISDRRMIPAHPPLWPSTSHWGNMHSSLNSLLHLFICIPKQASGMNEPFTGALGQPQRRPVVSIEIV